jgi:hypothetical protein
MTSIPRRAVTALAALALLTTDVPAADSVYTATSGKTCRKLPEGHLSGMRCQGPAGLSVVILDDGNVMGMLFGLPGKESIVSGMHWRAVGKLIGDRIEWRVAGAEPYAAIVRIFTLDDDEKPVQRLFIAKVTPARSCQIATIDAHQANANPMARQIADERAPSHQCQDPQ